MDPILDDELRRSRRIKQYQQYQDHLDQIDKTDASKSNGEIQGKKVKKLTNENLPAGNIFNRSIKKSLP